MSTGTTLILMALCVSMQGFFSGSEIALVSADRYKLRADAEQGRKGAILALKMLSKPAWSLGTCLVGTNLGAIGTATLGASLVVRLLDAPAALATLFVVPFTLTLGEMVPKAILQHHADRVVGIVVFPMFGLSWLLSPVLIALDWLTTAIGGENIGEGQAVSRQQIRLMLETPHASGLTPSDRALIRRVFAFTEAIVEDAMVPLIQVKAVPAMATVGEAAVVMTRSGHSRVPVYQDRIDQIIGVLFHHDLLCTDDWSAPVSSLARAPMFVPESKRVDQLLLEMRRDRQRIAVVVDEYGGSVGIITVEDLLEEIVGEIEDESDAARALVRRTGEREWVASGRAEREHLQEKCNLALPDGDFETVAGYVLEALGRIPRVGEVVRLRNYSVTVSKANERAVQEVVIQRNR